MVDEVGAAQPVGRRLAEATAQRNAWMELDLAALAANVAILRNVIGRERELIAVVKANAYGHGAPAISRALESLGVNRLAVAWVSEGVQLRRAGLRLPIIVLGHAYPADAAQAVSGGLTLTCHSLALGAAIAEQARALGTVARVHVKVDTGLHRFGVAPHEAVALAEALRRLPGLEVEGLSTHMANADEPDDSFAEQQGAAFERVTQQLDWIPFRHAANSATTFRRPDLRYDAVRCGISLYGVAPPNTIARSLEPVLSLRGRVARVVEIAPGEGVSYGQVWRARRASRAALIPVGYADGWRRSLSGRADVLLGGTRCPSIGRVAMDQFLVEATDLRDVAEGDEATLIGGAGGDRITADEVAERAGTISWEVLAGLGDRLPRIYHRSGIVELASSLDSVEG